MRRTLKKGFTLIELMVVIAIIGILATTLAPKLREQLAKAKDSKAVSFLGASRTVASSLIINQMTNGSSDPQVIITWKGLSNQMDVTTAGLISNTAKAIIIGGSRNKDGSDMTYGGTVDLYSNDEKSWLDLTNLSGTTTGANSSIKISEASDLHLNRRAAADKQCSTEGKAWLTY